MIAAVATVDGVVLVDVESERAEVVRDPVGDLALLPGRARDRSQLDEELGDLSQALFHFAELMRRVAA